MAVISGVEIDIVFVGADDALRQQQITVGSDGQIAHTRDKLALAGQFQTAVEVQGDGIRIILVADQAGFDDHLVAVNAERCSHTG